MVGRCGLEVNNNILLNIIYESIFKTCVEHTTYSQTTTQAFFDPYTWTGT